MKNLHKQFVQLGRERNRITYKLLALLPKIEKFKIYEKQGYANIYDYAARIAGLSPGVVTKTLKLEKKLVNMPHLQKKIETQGVNKVGIVVGLATEENERDLAEKVENMSKPALQEYSKEIRGKVTASWKVELDEKMMFMFLKLKKKLGQNSSNKECLRKILEEMIHEKNETHKIGRNPKLQKQRLENKISKSNRIPARKSRPEEQAEKTTKIPGENRSKDRSQILHKNPTRYIPAHKKRELSEHCSHQNCHRPADVIHHPDIFSRTHNHENLKPLCFQHHEFAHNGITEPMRPADYRYREHRQAALA